MRSVGVIVGGVAAFYLLVGIGWAVVPWVLVRCPGAGGSVGRSVVDAVAWPVSVVRTVGYQDRGGLSFAEARSLTFCARPGDTYSGRF